MAKRHVVSEGECLASIAAEAGFLPDTLWDHPSNADLKGRRATGYVLQPGDVINIPDLRPKSETCATGRTHRFRRRGVPSRLRVRLVRDDGEPHSDLPYRLDVDGEERTGRTDGQGLVQEWIAPAAQHATLTLETGDTEEEYELQLHRLLPVENDEGVRQRLENLGYLPPGERDSREVRVAMRRFQVDLGLEATGEADEQTRLRLLDSHGC